MSVRAQTTCGRNEVYMSCGTACPLTCKNVISGSGNICTKQCVAGCFCKAGYVRRASGGSCVLKSQCKW